MGHVAGIVAIYEGKKLLGAQPCTADGTFSVPITLSYGHHVLVATVMAITKEVGLSSSPLIVTREHPFSLTINTPLEPTPIIIKTDDPFIIIGSDGNATWKGSFKGVLVLMKSRWTGETAVRVNILGRIRLSRCLAITMQSNRHILSLLKPATLSTTQSPYIALR